jgi:hypothetical protein
MRRPGRNKQRQLLAQMFHQRGLPNPSRAKDQHVLPLRVQFAQPCHFFLPTHKGKDNGAQGRRSRWPILLL